MFVTPKNGVNVPDVDRGGFLSPAGRDVAATPYWNRLVQVGDVVLANPFFTLVNGAGFGTIGGAAGAAGQTATITGASTQAVKFDVTTTIPNQVVRLYAIISNVVGVIPRVTMTGANTLATTNLPASTSDPVAGGGAYHWYQTDIVVPIVGTTTIQINGSITASQTTAVYAADPDYRASTPGLTIHRISQAGGILADYVAGSLDDTDTQPAGGWIGGANATKRASQTDSLTTRIGMQGIIAGTDINDVLATSFGYGYTLADHSRHITNYLAAMNSRGLQVLLVVGNIRNPSSAILSGLPYTEAQVIEAYRAAAEASSNAAFLNINRSFTGATAQDVYNAQVADTSRWLASEAPDYVHPAFTGHQFYGADLGAQILAALP